MKVERGWIWTLVTFAGITMASANAAPGHSCASICVVMDVTGSAGGSPRIYETMNMEAVAADPGAAWAKLQRKCGIRARQWHALGGLYYGIFLNHTESEHRESHHSSSFSRAASDTYRSPYCYYRTSSSSRSGWQRSSSSFDYSKASLDWKAVESVNDLFCTPTHAYDPNRPAEYEGDLPVR